MSSLQEMILSLLRFWQQQDCVLHQGYDLEVGAGTFNPATFLRALGPEPYKTAYVEPSRRPQDGRFGLHPNRLQNYHQFQVLLKPVPENIQDLFLESLLQIGLNLQEHDIRFVHDDWENPTIGASGLGWEVWLNGMEITQITYFQNIGSRSLSTISGEITYGIERIAMYLQGKESVFDVMWNDTLTYGEIIKSSEFEWSRYNFEEANVLMWLRHFEDFEQEALHLLQKNLPIPAYDFVMKASHAFNILDARGIVSVTERTGYITRIRQLAKEVAEKYLHSRQASDFPLLKEKPHSFPTQSEYKDEIKNDKDTFLLEIGSEELPAGFVPKGMESFRALIEKTLNEEHFEFDEICVFGTPRRIGCLIYGLSSKGIIKATVKKGPPLSHIFSEDGTLTASGKNFFDSMNLSLLTLKALKDHPQFSIQEVKGVSYIFVSTPEESQSIYDVLLNKIPAIIASMTFPKKMRWNDSGFEYARPIRWLVALYGEIIIPIEISGIVASNVSQGHRQLSPGDCLISSSKTYITELAKRYVIVDPKIRHNMISDGLNLIREIDQLYAVSKERLLEETTFLSEYPFVIVGSFPERFVALPKELLIAEMVEHQRYFPLVFASGKMSGKFAVVIDNHPNDLIIQGNQRALRPRLTDGDFLFQQDLKQSLDTFLEKLSAVRFMDNLGSLRDKVSRIEENVRILCQCRQNEVSPELRQAVKFCKADLVSAVVNEFPELQGIMGYYYTLNAGYSEEVALAIKEHLSHIKVGAHISQTGALLSIADRIDNIISCFSNNLKPSSSNDPYALRRQTLEILYLIITLKLQFNFSLFLRECLNSFFKKNNSPSNNIDDIHREILLFTNGRFTTVLKNLGYSKDEMSIISPALEDFNYCRTLDLIVGLHEFKATQPEVYLTIIRTYKRLKKLITKDVKIENPRYEDLPLEEQDILKTIDNIRLEAERSSDYLYSLGMLSKAVNDFLDQFKIFDNNSKAEPIRLTVLIECLSLFRKYYEFENISLN